MTGNLATRRSHSCGPDARMQLCRKARCDSIPDFQMRMIKCKHRRKIPEGQDPGHCSPLSCDSEPKHGAAWVTTVPVDGQRRLPKAPPASQKGTAVLRSAAMWWGMPGCKALTALRAPCAVPATYPSDPQGPAAAQALAHWYHLT